MVVSFLERIVQPRNQIIALIITSVLAIIMAYIAAQGFISMESQPLLLPLTPKKVQEWGIVPTRVKTGFYIVNFPEFDIRQNQFIVNGILWFEFDPSLVSLETVEKFTFEKGEILQKSPPETRLIDDKLFAEFKIRVKFTTNLNHKLFPLDGHRIFLSLVNTAVSARELIYSIEQSAFIISPDVVVADWKIVEHDATYGYIQANLDKYDERKVAIHPKVIFNIDFARSGIRQIFFILLPMFLIFFVGLFSFAFNPETHASTVLGLASGSITSMLAYRFIVQRISPSVGYFILSDHIFAVFLAFAFGEFLFGIILAREGTLSRNFKIVRGLIFILFHVCFLTYWYYLLFHWPF